MVRQFGIHTTTTPWECLEEGPKPTTATLGRLVPGNRERNCMLAVHVCNPLCGTSGATPGATIGMHTSTTKCPPVPPASHFPEYRQKYRPRQYYQKLLETFGNETQFQKVKKLWLIEGSEENLPVQPYGSRPCEVARVHASRELATTAHQQAFFRSTPLR